MKLGWKESSKLISHLVIVSFIASTILPVVVLAEEMDKQLNTSETSHSDHSNLDSSTESVIVEENESDNPVISAPEMTEEKTGILDEKIEVQDTEKESNLDPTLESEEVVENQVEDEKAIDVGIKLSDEVDEQEEYSEDDYSEEVFSLEDNREMAMEILNSLQNPNARMMFSALPHTTEFIYNLAQSAVQLGNKNGLYPSVMMAQAILETGWGQSTLSAAPNYNLFGIKGNYNGNSVKMLTSEYTQDGKKIQIYDYFKVYPSYKESFQDYVDFIRNTKGITRYKNVWRENAPTYKHATAGLVSGGYATDPAYATMLNNLISFNHLDRYDNNPTVSYTTHVQSKGWLPTSINGKSSGTTGENKRMEAVKITIPNFPDLGIQYSAHVQDKGWMSWVSNGGVSGTSGESKRMEAIKIKLTGLQANIYDVYYRVHAQGNGWLGWTKNGSEAGTAGFGKRLEALEVKIVAKGSSAPGTTTNAYIEKTPNVNYSSHIQESGWQKTVSNGKVSGTVGASKRLEGMKIGVSGVTSNGGIQYRSHVQDYGWQNWVSDEALSGTSGKSKRLEAIQINLTGDIKNKYDVYYRVHTQTYGWLGWAKNGQSAGTEGQGKRLEGIEIRIVKKNGAAPGTTVKPFIK